MKFVFPGRKTKMKTLLIRIVLVSLCLASFVPAGSAADTARPAAFRRVEDVIYGRKFGTALTLDVIQPAKPNGFGIIFVVSGGWVSSHEAISPNSYGTYLERGYTIFAVVHGSQPKFHITEIDQDMNRAVRFIRHNAA